MNDESLKHTAIKGVGWSFIDSILNQGITFLVGLVLARLLSPEEYGILGILMIFIVISESIVNSGLSNALIRKQGATEDDFNTVFITNLLLSFVMYGVLFICAPYISIFFAKPQLSLLLRIIGIVVILNALSLVPNTKLVKRVNFRAIALCSLIAASISGIVGIGMALKGYGVWSLVGLQMSKQLTFTCALGVSNSWLPKLRFSTTSFKELWGFGWKLLVAGLIDTTWREIYKVIIGKCYSSTTLGQYTQAYQYSDIFSSNLTRIVQRVSYPILSKIQEERDRLKAAYRQVIKVTMLVTFILMFGLAGCAKQFIYVLIGEQWLPCVEYLQILCFSMALYPIQAINLNMLQVQGRSDLFLKLEIIKKCIGIIPLLLGIFFNIYWMLLCSVVTGWAAYYLNAHYSGAFLDYDVWSQIKDISPSMFISLCMGVIVYFIGWIPLSPYVLLPIQIASGAIFVFAVCEATKLEEYIQLKNIAYNILQKNNH